MYGINAFGVIIMEFYSLIEDQVFILLGLERVAEELIGHEKWAKIRQPLFGKSCVIFLIIDSITYAQKIMVVVVFNNQK